MPLEARLALLFALGAFIGGQVNRGIYRFALWNPRLISPWSAAPDKHRPRVWFDCLPILGWWTMRREADIHGRGFWIRPLLIELAMAVGFAWLYMYETRWNAAIGLFVPGAGVLHSQYFVHLVLISFMMVATFIDFDEQMIPDPITVPGALLGMIFAAVLPSSRLLVTIPAGVGSRVESLHVTSSCTPLHWNLWLASGTSLAIAIACYLGWYIAIVPWVRATPRRRKKAVGYFLASLVKRSCTPFYGTLLVAGPLAITGVWWLVGGAAWESLFSSLLGVAFGGGLVWIVRIVATSALKKEAMGFGDVLLMGMIGAYVGWQGSLAIFFLAPFASLVIAVTQWIITRRNDIAFGPYLCFATVLLVLNWNWLWKDHMLSSFSLGLFVPSVVLIAIGMMWLMLLGLQLLKRGLFGYSDEPFEDETEGGQLANGGK